MYIQGSTWQRRQAQLGCEGDTGHTGFSLRARGACWETFPLSRKRGFLPVTQPWPGNLCRTVIVSALQGPSAGHALAQPPVGHDPSRVAWPGLGFSIPEPGAPGEGGG